MTWNTEHWVGDKNMKRDKIIRLILLRQSGDISWWGKLRLRRELIRNPEVSRELDELNSLFEVAGRDPETPGPSPHVIERIKEEGRAVLKRRERLNSRIAMGSFTRLWHPALIYGTVSILLLAAGVSYMLSPRETQYMADHIETEPLEFAMTPWPDMLDYRIEELEDELEDIEKGIELVLLHEDEFWSELDAWAYELMRMEDEQI